VSSERFLPQPSKLKGINKDKEVYGKDKTRVMIVSTLLYSTSVIPQSFQWSMKILLLVQLYTSYYDTQ